MGERSQLDTWIAERIRTLRQARQLSLQALADASGVSRATLSRIENAEVSPTAETLGALSAVFSMTISALLAPAERPFEAVIRHADQSTWNDPSRDFERRIISPPSASLAVEMVHCRIGPWERIDYPTPTVLGQEHQLYLIEGDICVTVDGQRHALVAGDCLRYHTAGASCFETQDAGATYVIALH